MVKRFLEWIGLKAKLHCTEYIPPLFKEGEIWWCYIGENIGMEVNGKSGQFTRPVLIFKKYDRYSFLGLPLSTKLKIGSWYVTISFAGKQQTVVLAQGRVFDYRRFKEKMGELPENEIFRIHDAYSALHVPYKKIDLSPFPARVVGKSQI